MCTETPTVTQNKGSLFEVPRELSLFYMHHNDRPRYERLCNEKQNKKRKVWIVYVFDSLHNEPGLIRHTNSRFLSAEQRAPPLSASFQVLQQQQIS